MGGMGNIDWPSLETEYITNQTHKEVRKWFREVKGWSEDQLNNGNTKAQTAGWRTKRAQLQHQNRQKIMDSVSELEATKLDKLIRAKHQIIDEVVTRTKKNPSSRELFMYWKIIDTELDKSGYHTENETDTSKATLDAVREIAEALVRHNPNPTPKAP